MCWGDFLFVFLVFGPIWFVIFKGSMGGRFSGYSMVELKCICVSGVFSVMSNNIKYIRILLCLQYLVNYFARMIFICIQMFILLYTFSSL